jgi:K+-sensing histidine kinase KdpD
LVSGALDPPHPLLRGRQVAVRIEEAIPKADCDAATTRRILKLLLDNALKYSPSGTAITISSNLDRGAIDISVSDSGPGVPADEQPRIFEEHYRCSQHTSVFGTGLGLASAKKLVEWQGGQIWVTNRPEGGAAFHFSVPVAKGARL